MYFKRGRNKPTDDAFAGARACSRAERHYYCAREPHNPSEDLVDSDRQMTACIIRQV